VVVGSEEFTYGDLLSEASGYDLGKEIEAASKEEIDNVGPRVAIMAPPGAEYVVSTWAAWMTGGVAVPLAVANPPPELEYVLQDAKVSVVLATSEYMDVMKPLCEANGVGLVLVNPVKPGCGEGRSARAEREAPPADDAGALIIYTSGTTGRPKGALHTHRGLASQINSLTEAWEFVGEDRVLHALPLHHIHGIVNALLTPHYSGAAVEFQRRFNPAAIWRRLNETSQPPVTVFMGVPTMYVLMMKKLEGVSAEARASSAAAAARLRLTISGSAAMPVPVMQAWEALTGQRLLERYGMTEIGMALSNPYAPMAARRAGCVGAPLPGVEVRLVPNPDSDDEPEPAEDNGRDVVGPGEIRVRAPSVFKLYFGREEATAESFDAEGFFCTGDTGVCEGGVYRILGRTSVDIIKSGGFKLSALEIENHLLECAAIKECAVCGVPDDSLGEAVGLVVVYNEGLEMTDSDLRAWARDHMALYKVPKWIKVMDAIPRNAMGKVNKKQLQKTVFGSG